MTMTSSNHDIPATDSSSDDHSDNLSTRSPRRKRPSRRWFKRRWLRVLRPGNLIRASAVLLLPAAFIHVSLMNDVLSPRENGSASLYTEPAQLAERAESAERAELAERAESAAWLTLLTLLSSRQMLTILKIG